MESPRQAEDSVWYKALSNQDTLGLSSANIQAGIANAVLLAPCATEIAMMISFPQAVL